MVLIAVSRLLTENKFYSDMVGVISWICFTIFVAITYVGLFSIILTILGSIAILCEIILLLYDMNKTYEKDIKLDS